MVNGHEEALVEMQKNDEKDACSCEVVKPDMASSVHIPRCRFSSTYVFQCTQCPMVFVQPTSAIKHLIKTHNRPRLGLRMLREAILKRRIQLLGENNNESAQETAEEDCHCAYCKKNFEHNIDLSMHLLYCSVKDIVLQRRRVHFRHHSADYIRTAIEESKREHLDPTIPLDFSELWPISKQKLTKARQKLKQMEAKRFELLRRSALLHKDQHEELEGQPLEVMPIENTNQSQEFSEEINNQVEVIKKPVIVNKKRTKEVDKIKRKKEKREKKEKKEKKRKHKLENVTLEMSKKENKKQKKNVLNGNAERLHRKKLELSRMKSTNLDECNSSSSLISMESSENESTTPAAATSPRKCNPCRCKICNKKFDGLGNVRRHISMFHYRANRFGCKLCTYRAFRRYDIVNHLGFVHKMSEERELMAVQYVEQHEVQNNQDVDDDIELLSINSIEAKSKRVVSKTTVGRPRKVLSIEQTKQGNGNKQRRSKSKEMDISPSKRPIRNRIKTLEKDFVYDEDTKDANSTMRSLRRRQSSKSDDLFAYNAPTTNFIFSTLLSEDVLSKVKGAATRVLTKLVACGLATAASAPELPRQRPQMRPHVSDMNRDGMQAGRVIETVQLEQARLNSTLLDDTFLAAKINQIKKCSTNNKNLHNFRVKPSLVKEMAQCSVTRNLLMKVNADNMSMSNKFYIKQEENCSGAATEINAHLHLFDASTNIELLSPLRNIKQECVEETYAESLSNEANESLAHKRMRLIENV